MSRKRKLPNLARAKELNDLALSLQSQFDLTGAVSDINEAIKNHQQAVSLIPDGHPNKSEYLNDLGLSFQTRFEHTDMLSDIERAIENLQQSVSLTPDDDPDKPERLNNLGNAFASRFQSTEILSDIGEAIENQKQAVLLTPEGHPDRVEWLDNLGVSFLNRFDQAGELSDIDQAIKYQQEALSLTPDEDPDKSLSHNNLGVCFQRRFDHTGSLSDLEEAIKNNRQAVSLTPDGHSHKPKWLTSLGNSLESRFQFLGAPEDIEEAIKNHQRSVSLTPDGDTDKPSHLNNLGHSFGTRFERMGMLVDLEAAIKYHQQAVSLTPDGDPDKRGWLNNLGIALQTRFDHTGTRTDIEQAIIIQRQSVQITPDEHIDKPIYLSSLGNSLERRFLYTGVLSDVEDAIRRHQQAVLLTPAGHVDKPGRLHNLGIAFESRFQQTGVLSDLEEAIKNKQQAVFLAPHEHPDKPSWLNSLGASLESRFRVTEAPNDIEDAIKSHQQAVSFTPDGHPDKRGWLNNLGNAFAGRFEVTKTLGDLEEAIKYNQQAVSLTPDGHAYKPAWLNNLGISFERRYLQTEALSDLEEAIKNQRQAVLLTPEGHSHKPERQYNLGNCYEALFRLNRSPDDLGEAVSYYRSAGTSNVGLPSLRSSACRRWARLAADHDPSSALDAYRRAIDLIPRIAWIGDPIATRHSQLSRISDLPREAAAFALDVGNPNLALEWLEQGRSVVWNQLLDLRTSIVDLRQAHPDICDEFTRVSHELRNAVTRDSRQMKPSPPVNISLEEETQRHHRLAEEWDTLLQKIRSLPNFGGFLLPKKVSTLKTAAGSGPVVVINVHQRRCDALILESGKDDVHHIPLTQLCYEDVDKMHKSLRLYLKRSRLARGEERSGGPSPIQSSHLVEILGKLYSKVVHPILQNLGLITGTSESLRLPRIWWCPTGPLTFLPLHAASRKIPGGGRDGTSDHVMSSYTPTVNALLEARGIERKPFHQLTGIAMANTPGLTPLPGVKKEMAKIEKHFPAGSEWTFETRHNEQATGERVLADMASSSWIHLACHAVQDVNEPTQSGFCLHDRRLMITDIVAKPFSNPDFAFLSACKTATGDEVSSDEAVHITGAMLGAGYRSVIGTMWAISDDAAPIVAEKVYENLLGKGEPNSEGAAQALHEGLKELLKSGEALHSRVPFVHYGV